MSVYETTYPVEATVEPLIDRLSDKAFNFVDDDILMRLPKLRQQTEPDICASYHLLKPTLASQPNMVLDEMEGLGLRSATLLDLIAFADRYPDRQRYCMIVGLGTIDWSRAGRKVPVLNGDRYMRRLELMPYDTEWHYTTKFLVTPVLDE